MSQFEVVDGWVFGTDISNINLFVSLTVTLLHIGESQYYYNITNVIYISMLFAQTISINRFVIASRRTLTSPIQW